MARRGDAGGGDRPRKSWSEIDKARGRSRHTSADRPDHQQERLEKSQAYKQYKTNLDKFFGGTGAAPDGLKAILDPSGEKSARTKAVEEIQKASAEDRRKWADLVKQFVLDHELPPDVFLLTEFLGHPKEAVAAKALAKLAQMMEAGELKKIPASLEQHLRSLELTSDDEELKAAATALREKLRGG